MKYLSSLRVSLVQAKELLLLFVFTVVCILIRGYDYGLGNQIHYLTYLTYTLNPSSYPNDYLLKTHTIPYTVYIDFLRFLPSFAGSRQIPLFLIYVLFLYFFYLGLFYLSNTFFSSKKKAWVMLLFFIILIPVGGSSITTVEKELDPRFIAEALLLPSLYFLTQKRTALSAVLAAIGFLFHPLTLLVYPPIVGLLFLQRYLSLKKILIAAGTFLVIILPLLSKFFTQQAHVSQFIDKTWKAILLERMPYIFALHWAWYDLVLVTLIPLFFFFYPKLSRSFRIHPVVTASLCSGYLFFLINIFSEITSFRLGLQLQLTRNLYLPILFSLMFFVNVLLQRLRGIVRIAVLSCILLVLFLTTLQGRQTGGFLWTRPLTDYEKTAVWAREHTPQTSVFLVPPHSEGFRFWSERSVVVENKEGGDSLYDRRFGIEWDRREDELEDIHMLTKPVITQLEKEYHVTDIVTTQSLPFAPVFTSGVWRVYHLG